MDKKKADALAKALKQIDSGETSDISVKVQGYTPCPPDGLQQKIEAELGRSVRIVWQQITKRDIPRTNSGEITDGQLAEQRYYEEAARRGAKTGD